MLRKSQFIFIIVVIGIFSFISTAIILNSDAVHLAVKKKLEDKLNAKDMLPSDIIFDAAYVLGGSPSSLYYKFVKAADLFHKGRIKHILILDQPGITAYEPGIGRNLTNNEWAIKTLSDLGIAEEKIEIFHMEEGFFGTYTEAKHISALIKKRRYKNTLLISVPCHTQRVRESFMHFFKNNETVFLIGSAETYPVKQLLIEYIKLLIYRHVLLL